MHFESDPMPQAVAKEFAQGVLLNVAPSDGVGIPARSFPP